MGVFKLKIGMEQRNLQNTGFSTTAAAGKLLLY
jgi:hypothetical protein